MKMKLLFSILSLALLSGCGMDIGSQSTDSYELQGGVRPPPRPPQPDNRLRDWNRAFYSGISKREKARLIASAVRGIGDATSEKLVYNGYFRYKPASWNAFKNHMRNAANDRRLNTPDVYRNTVERYGSDNSKLFRSGGGGGGGNQGRWGCTFDHWRSDSSRANCLADAVRGIGQATATTLIKNNEFRYPPQTWTKFKDYMRSLSRRYGLNDLYTNTVERYGSSNRQNLYP